MLFSFDCDSLDVELSPVEERIKKGLVNFEDEESPPESLSPESLSAESLRVDFFF